jgi:cytochrome c peroxidase
MRALTLAVTLATMTAAAADPTLERAQAVFKPLSAQFESMDNPITPAKVALGRALYFEKRLSKNHDLSCNSCHVLSQLSDRLQRHRAEGARGWQRHTEGRPELISSRAALSPSRELTE